MQCAFKISSLLIILAHTFFSVTTFAASPKNQHMVGTHTLLLQQAQAAADLAATHTPKQQVQLTKEALPLVKVAHANVMDLLHLFFIAETIHVPSYTPLLQQVGIRVNWFECLRNLWASAPKGYRGGVDLHFRGPIQLSVDIGYVSYQPKNIVYGNALPYKSAGIYGLGALLYVIHPNPLTQAYVGVAYGQSRFDLMTFCNDQTTSKPFIAGWIKLVGGSEYRLVPQLYGGMQLGIAHLLYCKKHNDGRVSNYDIPGYGKIVNKIMPDVTLYLKWSISCLEKKIVI